MSSLLTDVQYHTACLAGFEPEFLADKGHSWYTTNNALITSKHKNAPSPALDQQFVFFKSRGCNRSEFPLDINYQEMAKHIENVIYQEGDNVRFIEFHDKVEAEKADDIEAALHATKSHIDEFIDAIKDFDQVEHETDLDELYEETMRKKEQNKRNQDIHNAPYLNPDDPDEEDVDLTDLEYEEAPEEWLQAAGTYDRQLRFKRVR